MPTVTAPTEELPLPRVIDPLVKERLALVVVRLRTASFTFIECVIVPLLVRSITTLLDAVGTTPPTQLLAVSQSPPVGATVVFHMIVDSTVRFSRLSIKGLSVMVRFRSAPRLRRNITVSMNTRRGEWSMETDPFLQSVSGEQHDRTHPTNRSTDGINRGNLRRIRAQKESRPQASRGGGNTTSKMIQARSKRRPLSPIMAIACLFKLDMRRPRLAMSPIDSSGSSSWSG